MKSTVRNLILISCVSQKRTQAVPARQLYISPLFVKALAYAEQQNPDAIYILSAKYGLVGLDTVIEPYDETLNTMATSDRRRWAEGVIYSLRERVNLEQTHVTLLAGTRYREYLLPAFRSYDVHMKGLTIGRQLQFLSEHVHA